VFFQNAPTALDGIVLTLVGGIIEEVNRFADAIRKRHHPLQKLGANAATFGTIINFELNLLGLLLLIR
jgi:hypothetical protein